MKIPQKFKFGEIENFDRHIKLSIPDYDGLFNLVSMLSLEYLPENGRCVDIGCSTGALLNTLADNVQADYTGVDTVKFGGEKHFNYIQKDCLEYLANLDSADLLLSVFTLQFLPQRKRAKVFFELKRLVADGAVLIVAEKTFSKSPRINSIFQTILHQAKRNHFSDTEILDKDSSLLGAMHCQLHEDVVNELSNIGDVVHIWQSLSFHGWVVTKKNNPHHRR